MNEGFVDRECSNGTKNKKHKHGAGRTEEEMKDKAHRSSRRAQRSSYELGRQTLVAADLLLDVLRDLGCDGLHRRPAMESHDLALSK